MLKSLNDILDGLLTYGFKNDQHIFNELSQKPLHPNIYISDLDRLRQLALPKDASSHQIQGEVRS